MIWQRLMLELWKELSLFKLFFIYYSETSGLIAYKKQIIKTADPMLVSKAAYLTNLVQDKERSECVLEAAAKSPYVIVRIAVIDGVENLSPDMANKLLNLLRIIGIT